MTMHCFPGWRRTLRRVGAALFSSALIVMPDSAASAQSAVRVGVPGRSNDAVSIAAAGQFVALVWGAATTGGMDVYSAVSRDGGAVFSAPVRVNETALDARVGGEQPPHLVLVPRPRREPSIVVVWNAGRRPDGGRLLTARSDDAGATFGATSVVPGTAAAGPRGWASTTVDASGKVYVMWLDHRNTVAARATSSASGPAAPTDPVAQAALSQLYIASLDGATAPRALTSSVCYCCKTALTTAADGSIYGVWRHVFPGDFRDMAFTVSRDHGRTFSPIARVSSDGWAFDGCPDNGPSVAVDASKRVHVAWPSPADVKNASVMALFYAMSADGRTFAPRVRIPTTGPAGHVQLVTERDGSLVLAWEEASSTGKVVRLARGATDRASRTTFRVVGAADAGKYPSMAVTSTGAVVAWSRMMDGSNEIAVSRVLR
jgi:hypothetical protein